MNLGELKQDGVIIQLADRSNVYPKGVLEDVLVQVNHLIFLADFYVLEMEDSSHGLFSMSISIGFASIVSRSTRGWCFEIVR